MIRKEYMGIEAIGSIGSAIGSVASAVGKGTVPAVAGLAKFGPELKGVYLPTIINEGPVVPKFLENTMQTLKIGKLEPITEIKFNEPSLVPTVITQAEAILFQTQKDFLPAPLIMPGVEPVVIPRELPKEKSIVEAQPKLHSVTDVRVEHALEKQEIEEPKETLEEEKTTEREIFVEDIEVSAQRRWDIKKTIKMVKEIAIKLGLKKITGAQIAELMPAEYPSVRSQPVKNTGPDGSYQETIDKLKGAGEFISEMAAGQKADEIIAENKPIKYGKNSVQIAYEHVARVFKYWVFKPKPVIEIVKSRVIRKKTQTIPLQVPAAEIKSEKNLGELDSTLAGVFQRTA